MLPFEHLVPRVEPVARAIELRQLPLHVRPERDEALYSWLHRLASELGTSVHALAQQAFGVDDRSGHSLWWCRPHPWLLARMSDRTGIPVRDLRRMTLEHLEPPYRDDEANERFAHRRYDASPPNHRAYRFVVCRQCLQEESVSYVRSHWLLGWLAVCPKHERVLIVRCQKCHAKLRVPPFHTHAAFSPETCASCQGSLLDAEDWPANPMVLRLQATLLEGKERGQTSLPGIDELTWKELVAFLDVLMGMFVTDLTGEETHDRLFGYQYDRDEPWRGYDTSLGSRYGSLLFIAWLIEGWPTTPGTQVGVEMLHRWASGKRNRISRHLGAKYADPWTPHPHDIEPEIKQRLHEIASSVAVAQTGEESKV